VAYSEIFKDHIAHPRHAGRLENATARAEQTNPVCGDRIELSLRLVDNRIDAVGFLAYGCAPTLACGSALAEMIEKMSYQEASGLTRQDIVSVLGGLPSGKQHAAALAIEVLKAALKRYL
jgi:nitrogen fixation NifU-like protein